MDQGTACTAILAYTEELIAAVIGQVELAREGCFCQFLGYYSW